MKSNNHFFRIILNSFLNCAGSFENTSYHCENLLKIAIQFIVYYCKYKIWTSILFEDHRENELYDWNLYWMYKEKTNALRKWNWKSNLKNKGRFVRKGQVFSGIVILKVLFICESSMELNVFIDKNNGKYILYLSSLRIFL